MCGDFVITITNNDIVSITQSKPSSNVPQAYILESADELNQINAVDGSMAIVHSDSLIGEWGWHQTLGTYPQEEFDIYVKFLSGININGTIVNMEFDNLYFDNSELIYYGGEGNVENSSYFNGVWIEGLYRKIIFIEDVEDTIFKSWYKNNADRISGGKSLYTHENGEWIYKCEIV